MEFAKRIIHKEGLHKESLAAVCDADQSHSGGDEQKQLDTNLARGKVKDSEVLSEEEAKPEGLASVDVGNGMVEHGEGVRENPVTSDTLSSGSEGNEPHKDESSGNEQETNT